MIKEIADVILSLINGETIKCYYADKEGKGVEAYIFATDHSFSWSTNPPGTADSVVYYVYSFEDFSGFEIFKVQKPKKKYWLWDVKESDLSIVKDKYYMDDDGITSSGLRNEDPEYLVRKHENEWIEV